VAAAEVFVKSLGHETTEIVTGAIIERLLGSESSDSDININSAHTVEDYGDDISSRPSRCCQCQCCTNPPGAVARRLLSQCCT